MGRKVIRVYDKLLTRPRHPASACPGRRRLGPLRGEPAKRMGDDRAAQGAQSRTPERQTEALPRAPGGQGDAARLDADSGKRLAHYQPPLFPSASSDLAVELREYFIPDFSNWKNHDAFETAFARLLKDLKADTSGV